HPTRPSPSRPGAIFTPVPVRSRIASGAAPRPRLPRTGLAPTASAAPSGRGGPQVRTVDGRAARRPLGLR
ncbi:hypothetical protein, partial [Streptomyces sp. DSM 41978]|uniref:hypothetical protein n=1 Tax=Streptomyces sp. DSM 41978 TaxID=3448658 RepID=UPI004040358A